MIWVAPSEKDNASAELEKRFRAAADQFGANSPFNINAKGNLET